MLMKENVDSTDCIRLWL